MIEFDQRRVERKHAFHAFAVGNLADGEALVEPAAVARDNDAFIGLNARALAFLHLHIDDHRVAGAKLRDDLARDELGRLFGVDFFDDVHIKLLPFRLGPPCLADDERFGTLF